MPITYTHLAVFLLLVGLIWLLWEPIMVAFYIVLSFLTGGPWR